ncbi:MAG TPA: hypothetical protein VGU19_09825 [Microvirga sp.]|nr:hypothetical protein [Microvirga sp.]
MPVELSVSRDPDAVPAVFAKEGSRPRILEAAADRSIIQEDPKGPMLPPAGASRAETVFATVGSVLLLILAVAFVWTLVRQHRR